MDNAIANRRDPASIRDLFPDFTEQQLHEVEARLEEYLAFTVELYDRIRADPDAYRKFKLLTAAGPHLKMEAKGRVKNQ